MSGPYLQMVSTSAGAHALFAARVRHWPFGELSKHVWEPWGSDGRTQLLERQMRFINALHPGVTLDHQPADESFTVDLRYLCRPGVGQVDCVLVGKAPGSTESEAQAAAEALWEKLTVLLPLGYDLELATQAEFDDWTGADLVRRTPEAAWQWAEVRRPAEFLLWTARQLPARRLPVVYPFAWHPSGWEAVWLSQVRVDQPSLVSVSLRPAEFSLVDETYVADLTSDFYAVAAEAGSPLATQAEQFAELYTEYLAALRIPFSMRVAVMGPRPVSLAVRNALSGPIWPAEETSFPLAVAAEVVSPGEAHLSTMRENLERLEQTPWDPYPAAVSPAPFLERLRYLTGAAGALCAFRLPVLPADGLPGVRVGAEMPPPHAETESEPAAAPPAAPESA